VPMKNRRAFRLLVICVALIIAIVRNLLLSGRRVMRVGVVSIVVVRISVSVDGYRMQNIAVTAVGPVRVTRRSCSDAEPRKGQRNAG